MNPLAMIPVAYRAAIYAFAGVANLVVIYLAAVGKVGVSEVALVAGIITFLGLGTAGSNLTRDPKPPESNSYDTGTTGTEFLNERGDYNAGSLLTAVACLVIILVGLVWLVRAF